MKKYYALFNPVYFAFLQSKGFDFESFKFKEETGNFIFASINNKSEEENLRYELQRFIQSLDENDRWLFKLSTGEHLLVDFITEDDTELEEFEIQKSIGQLIPISEKIIQRYGVRSFLL